MKRSMQMIVISCVMMSVLIGCSSQESEVQTDMVVTEAEEVETADGTEKIEEEIIETEEVELTVGQVELNGVLLEIGQNITDDIITSLGAPLETLQAPSCHYDGNDTIYTYEDFVLYVYQDGEDTPLYIIELDTDKVATREGVSVGMTSDEVMNILGESCTLEGTFLSYTEDGITTDCFLDESNLVWYIEIF